MHDHEAWDVFSLINLGGPMRSLTKFLLLILTLWGFYWFFSRGEASAANADIDSDYDKKAPQDSRASKQLLPPLMINEKYLRSEIPAEDSKGPMTLHGAVTEAAVHNKDVQGARLQVSQLKWSYRAAETTRLPNVRLLSYLSQ